MIWYRFVGYMIMAFVLEPHVASAQWKFRTEVDELDDVKITTASIDVGNLLEQDSIVLKCKNNYLEAYVTFATYLNNDEVLIKYRVDKGPLKKEKWFPSADGKAMFADEAADFARALARGNQLIIEAEDYRGSLYREKFSLAGSASAIYPVLQICGRGTQAPHERLSNVRRDVSLNAERMGPSTTENAKAVLKAMGFYDGEIDGTKNDQFFVALSTFFEDYLIRCRRGEVAGTVCRGWKILKFDERSTPLPSLALYEMAPEPYRGRLGKLKIGE